MKTHTLVRSFGAVLFAGLLFAPTVAAQTATTTTTTSAALAEDGRSLTLASTTGVEAGGALFIDREAFDVLRVNTTTGSVGVRRGAEGTRAVGHPSGSLVYVATKTQKPKVFTHDQALGGSCTRAAEEFLPQIDVTTGTIWDCPVGATLWAPINAPGYNTVRSEAFNLDNGAGTTIDAVLIRSPRPIQIVACRIVYEDATTGTVAAGNARLGTTVGGSDIVASTAYENAKAVGTSTAMTIVNGTIPAATPVLVRHTGVAVTQAGEAVVECDVVVR